MTNITKKPRQKKDLPTSIDIDGEPTPISDLTMEEIVKSIQGRKEYIANVGNVKLTLRALQMELARKAKA